jgi:putative transposase
VGVCQQLTLHFITSGRTVENGYIESFNGKFREECLTEHWLLTLDHARETIEDWQIDYNEVHPYSALGYRTPEEFANELCKCGKQTTLPTFSTAPTAATNQICS